MRFKLVADAYILFGIFILQSGEPQQVLQLNYLTWIKLDKWIFTYL